MSVVLLSLTENKNTMKANFNTIEELTPLSEEDCFYIADRYKTSFTYPIHTHVDFELNFIANASGVKRIVGDSETIIGNYDLVLIANDKLEHGWLQNECASKNIREITIQFSPDLFFANFQNKNQFDSIREMLKLASKGVCFPMSAILKVYSLLDCLSSEDNRFYSILSFFAILYKLSLFIDDVTFLASKPCTKVFDSKDQTIKKLQKYILRNFRSDIRLEDLARVANLSTISLSRYFKQELGVSVSEYVTKVKIDNATRLLLDTELAISDIATESGFNNLSNFNRQFRKSKGCSPSEFKEHYGKTRLII